MATTARTTGVGAPSTTAVDVGCLIARVVIGFVFLAHGLQKFGMFTGGGLPTSISEQADFLRFGGYEATTFLSWVLTLTEIGAGVSLLLGFLTPLGAAGVLGIGSQFILGLQWPNGLFGGDAGPGYELTFMLAGAVSMLAFVGPGRYSLDARIGRRIAGLPLGSSSVSLGVAAIVLGLGVGVIVLAFLGPGLFPSGPPTG